ncbi:ras-related protein RABA4b-like [Quercus robur]|uniref:ras-related protein RABA4b-like n=1 Tax=Quercus robur TaxID=38942 RepID=UPI0021616E65|nr:ras-related protein RABA4b-like [Quercus robur]
MASQGKEGYGVSEQRIDCEFKVVLIGDFEIGKCETLVLFERKETEPGTFIVKYETQTLQIEKKSVKANISGIIPTKQNNIDSNADYADGVILVYDITNHTTFECMTPFLEELRRHAKKRERQDIILIGNKSESPSRSVTKEEAQELAEKNNLIFREMPALEGTNFDKALEDLLTQLVNNTGTNTASNTGTNTATITTTSTTTSNTTTNDNTNNWNLTVHVNIGK